MSFSKEILKGNVEIIVLQVLDELHEAYGYQLLGAIQEQSHDIFTFQESTLYPLLYRLEEKGWLRSERKVAPSGKERRYYFLTPKGKENLVDKRQELTRFFEGMRFILKMQNE